VLVSPLGAQAPRVLARPPASDSLGAEAAEFAASVGLNLDPWQRLACDVTFGLRGDGKWSAFEVGLLVARQNGKGGFLEAVELAKLFLFGDRLILHSAHEFKTAAEAFLRVKAVVDGSDDLSRMVQRMRTSHGEEGIELTTGARLRFVARSRSSGKGFSGDTVILDEAQEMPRAAIGALMPTLSARPNPQVIYTGTVPGPNDDGEHWESVRDRGRAGKSGSLAWLEWSPGERLDDLGDRAAWAAANPALGIRITEETIERELDAMGAEEFARERLSLWGRLAAQTVIDPDVWSSLADGASQADTRTVVFAADVAPDRQRGSIAVAGERPDGRVHVEVVENARGIAWMAPWLVERCKKYRAAVVLDPGSPAGALVPDLQKAGVEPLLMTTRDVGQACGMFFDGAVEDRLRHLDDPRLNTALAAGRKRDIGVNGLWAWHRRDTSTDLTPLVAATNAVWGFLARRPEPGRKRATGRSRSY
jgi:phage terminase large subunit-like protein